MNNKSPITRFLFPSILFFVFIVFTLCVKFLDVQPAGVLDSVIGFASINLPIHVFFGVHPFLDKLTDIFLGFTLLVAFAFAILGLIQLIKHRLDSSILFLGLFYIVVILFYFFFEKVIINCRPILQNGELEASYPSSHTLLIICILDSAIIVLNKLFNQEQTLKENKIFQMIFAFVKPFFTIIICATVLCRLFSGVHWFTDILGGILLSVSLVEFFKQVISLKN